MDGPPSMSGPWSRWTTFATLAPALDVGAEVDWGRRVDKDGLRAEALRITFTGRYDF